MDLSVKYICFETDGEEHFITFRYSHRNGVTDVVFDRNPVKVADAYPPLFEVMKICGWTIVLDFKYFWIGRFKKLVHKKQCRNQSGQK